MCVSECECVSVWERERDNICDAKNLDRKSNKKLSPTIIFKLLICNEMNLKIWSQMVSNL